MDYYKKYIKYKTKYLLNNSRPPVDNSRPTVDNTLIGGNQETTHITKAIAFVRPCDPKTDINGVIYFTEQDNLIRIHGEIKNLIPGKHGFHVHESGNLTHCCTSLKGHFNPTNSVHGGPNSDIRHVGDLGNIDVNSEGVANIDFTDHLIKLNGTNSIIGRSLVIHEDEDDLGLGGNAESLKTGNAGTRIAYAIIGLDT